MSITVEFDGNENVRVTDEAVERQPPDRLAVSIAGTLTVTDATLSAVSGARLNPVRATVSADDAEPVEIDLTGPASLRLENVDVGVATPDGDEIAAGIDALRPSGDGSGAIDPPPDVIAFTVDGTIRDVPPRTLEAIGGDPDLESVTFAVAESVRSDGGSRDDVVFECTLLGYGIVVRRDGTIVVGSAGGMARIGLP